MPALRRQLLALCLWLQCAALLALLLPQAASAQPASGGKRPERLRFTQVFDARQQIGPIYYPAHAAADDPERKAAQELARTLETISGQPWEVLPEPPTLPPRGIFIGRTQRAFVDGLWRAGNPHAPLQLPTDRIELAVAPGRISLVGENPQATLAGVYRFLETHAGARWYAPGELGEEIPALRQLRLQQGRSHWQPSFRDRRYYAAAPNKAFYQWAERMGGSRHFNSTHNLHRVFTPELFQTNPEYWAKVDGKRRPPGTNERTSQLDYTHPGVARLTAQAARAAFEANPQRLTFSLGINDTIDFGDDAPTREAISPLRYHHGHPVFSDLVFTFANAVAREIAQTHPDRYLPVLAYMWAEAVPGFPLEPNLLPYLCLDHAQWYDPERRQADMELTRQWAKNGAAELGSWEYYFGSGYFIPRVFNQITAESLKFIHDQGFRAIFMESGANTGFDAPKMWLATRLIWDIDADPAALLEDFYHGYYGAAGATMQQLFEYCERIWMEQEGHAYWLKYFLNAHQAALYPPQVMDTVEALLATARSKLDAAHAPQRFYLRLQQTADNFAYLRAASNYYHTYTELLTMPLDSAQDVLSFLRLNNAFATARRDLEQAPALQLAEPWYMRPQLLQLRPGGRLAAALWKDPHLAAIPLPPATAQPAPRKPEVTAAEPPATANRPTTPKPQRRPAPAQPAAKGGKAPKPTAAEPLLTAQQILSAADARLLQREDFSTEVIAGDTLGFAPQKSHSGPLPSGWNLRWTHHENARLLRHRPTADTVAGAIATDSIAADTIDFGDDATGATAADTTVADPIATSDITVGDIAADATAPIPAAGADARWQLTLADQEFVSLFRWIELPPDAQYVGTRMDVRGEIRPGSQVRINLGWLDANHQTVGQSVSNLLPPRTYGQWQDFAVAAQRPKDAAWLYIGIRVQQQAPGEMLHLRDWETFYWQTKK